MIGLRAARVLVEGAVRHDVWVVVDGGRIAAVGELPADATAAVDLGAVDLIPGLVDLHCDCLEERAHPRPGRDQPLAAALLQLDAELAAHGLTTAFVCATMEDDPIQHRSTGRAVETVRCVAGLRDRLRVEHRVHLRVELTSDVLELVRELAADDVVGLISYMHHTPGSGQFASGIDDWRAVYAKGFDGSDAELRALIADRQARGRHVAERRAAIAVIAADSDTPLASHDDGSPGEARLAVDIGARISEFPLSVDAAGAADETGLGVVMGAPNAWRGGSHLGGLAARDVLAAGALGALASDYHPPSLLAAAYALADEGAASWEDAIALVTSGPAAMAGLDDRGTIAPGRRGDLVAVERIDGYPVVRQAWVAGMPVLGGLGDRARSVVAP